MSNYPQQHAQQQQPAQQMPYPTHPAPGPGTPSCALKEILC